MTQVAQKLLERRLIMAWSETAFRARLEARAAELGKPLRALLAEAGIAHDTIDKIPSSGRRIDTLEKIAVAFEWTLAEVMGFSVLGRLSLELSKLAFDGAKQANARLPRDTEAREWERVIEAHAVFYDVLAARQRAGLTADAATVAICVDTYVGSWEGHPQAGTAGLLRAP